MAQQYRQKLAAAVLAAAFCLSGASAAQAANTLEKNDASSRYSFGSVQAAISSNMDATVSGARFFYSLKIGNKNPYPIADGAVVIKIFRKQEIAGSENSMKNGDFVVGEFVALEDVNLAAGEVKEFPLEWKVPGYLASGSYRLATYVLVDKKFNLSGLPFTDDIIGSSWNLKIVNSEISGTVEFNKNAAKFDGEPYAFIGFPQTYAANKEIPLDVPLVNTTNATQQVTVFFDVYAWDAISEKSRLSSHQEAVTVPANGRNDLRYLVAGNDAAVNYAVIRAQWYDTQSILGFRFAREAKKQARINFLGLSDLPFEKGKVLSVFANVHALEGFQLLQESDSTRKSEPGIFRLVLRLKDGQGKLLKEFERKGDISADLSEFGADYRTEWQSGRVILEGEIRDGEDKVIDSASVEYDCGKLQAGKCQGMGEGSSRFSRADIFKFFGLATVILVILVIVVSAKKRRRIGVWLIFIMLGGMLLGISGTARAESITAGNGVTSMNSTTYTHSDDYGFKARKRTDGGSQWGPFSADYSVIFSGKSTAGGNATLNVNDTFTISNTTYDSSSNLTWSASGSLFGTPNGSWVDDLGTEPGSYTVIVGRTAQEAGYKRFSAAYVHKKPNIEIITSGPVSCTGSGPWTCTVNGSVGADNISVTLKYRDASGGSTGPVGTFWYKSEAWQRCGVYPGVTCHDDEEGTVWEKISGVKHVILDDITARGREKLNCNSTVLTTSKNACSNVRSALTDTANPPEGSECSVCEDPGAAETQTDPVDFTWNYTRVIPNNAPTASLSCPSGLETEQDGSFKLTCDDPDGNQVNYLRIDWDSNGVHDNEAVGPFSEPYTGNFTKKWVTAGTKTIKGWCYDANGMISNTASCSVPVTQANPAPRGEHVWVNNSDCTTGGWAVDDSAPSQGVNIYLYKDSPVASNFLGQWTTAASLWWDAQLPNGLKDSQNHKIYAYAIDIPGGSNPLLTSSPRDIRCFPVRPAPTVGQVCGVPYSSAYQMNISWNAAGQGASGYYVDISTDPNFGSWTNKWIPAGTTSTTAPDGFSWGPTWTLVKGTTYYVRVYYVQSQRHSPVVSFNQPINPPAPTITPNCPASGTSTYQSTISWTNPSNQGAGGYWVDISTDPNFAWYWNKQIALPDTVSTIAPDEFSGQPNWTLNKGTQYYTRTYYNNTCQHSATANFSCGYQCIGSVITDNAARCTEPGDDVFNDSDHPFKLVTGCTADPCEYVCQPTFTLFSKGCSGQPCCLTKAVCPEPRDPDLCDKSCGGGHYKVYYYEVDNTNTCQEMYSEEDCNTQRCDNIYREVNP